MKGKKIFTRYIAVMMSFVLTLGTIPVTAFAEDGTGMTGGFTEFKEGEPAALGEIIEFAGLAGYVAEQTLPYASELTAVSLPETLTATVRAGLPETEPPEATSPEAFAYGLAEKEIDVPVKWSCPDFDGEQPGTYRFTAAVTDGGFIVTTEPPVITVTVGEEAVTEADQTEATVITGFQPLESEAASIEVPLPVNGAAAITLKDVPFPEALTAYDGGDGGTGRNTCQIPVDKWICTSCETDCDFTVLGRHTFKPEFAAGEYTIDEGAETPQITVNIVMGVMKLSVMRTVSTFTDFKNAIDAFNTGSDDMEITIGASFTLTELFSVSKTGKTLTIKSAGSSPYTLKRSKSGKLFTVQSGTGLILKNITIDGNMAAFQDSPYCGGALIYVDGGILTMQDGATLKNNKSLESGSGVYVKGGTFNMEGGVISGNHSTIDSYDKGGGGVYVNGGTFNISGSAKISENTAVYGGGVLIYEGTSSMSGGFINNNTANNYAGGIYVNGYSASFTMTSGEVSGNTATNGGGVWCEHGTFTMTGSAVVSNNKAAGGKGGGVYIGKEFNMGGSAKVSGNTASSYGGGVHMTNGTITMTGGTLSNNTANNGGGVCMASGSFDMTGCTLSNNTASSGGGVNIIGGYFNISGSAEISGNTASSNGGGVYTSGTFTMTGGMLSNNTAVTGGGVYGAFTMTGGMLSNNTANTGGGVYTAGGFTMRGTAEISGNTASSNGGGVYLGSSAVFKVGGNAKVLENKLSKDGGAPKSNVVFASLTTYITILTGNDMPVVGGMEIYVNGINRTIVDTGASESYAKCFKADNADDGMSVIFSGGKIVLANIGEDGFWNAVADYGTATENMVINIDNYASNGVLTLGRIGSIPDNSGQNKPTLTIKSMSGNTKILRGTKITGNLFTVSSKARLILSNITVDGNKDAFTASPFCGGALICVKGELTMQSGAILKNNKSAANNGGVFIDGGTFNMSGTAVINGNTVDGDGGGVYLRSGTFDMTGGTLSNNIASSGGGVYISGGTFTMTGGTISGNKSTINSGGNGGGGVCVASGGTFNISGSAKISENTAVCGGGVFINDGTSSMSGGFINNNTANSYAGGIYVNGSRASFTMTGGEIRENSSTGGGMYVSGGTVAMSGGKISKNTASSYGGGVYVNSGTITMTGCTLSDNTAKYGGGVYIGSGTITMTGGTLSNNLAKFGYAGGVYIGSSGVFKVGGKARVLNNKQWTETDQVAVYYESKSNVVFASSTTYISLLTGTDAPMVGEMEVYVSGINRTIVNTGAIELYARCFKADENGQEVIFSEGKIVILGLGEDAFWTAITAYGTATEDMVIDIDKYASNGMLTLSKIVKIPDNKGQNKPTLTIKSGSGGNKIRRGTNVSGNLFTVTQDARLILSNVTVDGNMVAFTAYPYCGGALVYVNDGGTFTMDAGATLSNNRCTNGSGVYVSGSTAVFNMNGGTISNNTASFGGGVYVSAGTFTMTGGKLSNNTSSSNGGGVYASGGTFTMSGGEISENNSTINSDENGGGGVYVKGGTFTMEGGTLNKNQAIRGGGVYMYDSTFTMTGGTLSNNWNAHYGGGVYLYGSSRFTMTGGTLSKNTAAISGGGVYCYSGTFNMYGTAAISGNTATTGSGSGVYMSSGTFNMYGTAAISGNTAEYSGGGVYLRSGAFVMSGSAEIIDNTVKSGGGGVYVSGGTFTMSGGEIKSNIAPTGGGVYVSGGTLTMSGGEIKSNIAPTGGGVYLGSSAVFKVGGNAKVLENKLSTNGDAPKSNVVFANSTTYISLLTGSDAPVVGGMEVYVSGALNRTIVNTGAVSSYAHCLKADDDSQEVIYSGGKLVLLSIVVDDFLIAVESYGKATEDMVINIDDYASDGIYTLPKTVAIPNNNGQNKPTLTIKSVSGDTKILRGAGVTGDLFTVSRDARLILKNITVDGNKDAFTASPYCDGSLIYVNGVLTMQDGTTLQNNKSAVSGGVYVNGGTFNMEGGEISGNNSTIDSSSNGGGGVCVASGGTFNISGSAKISENTAVRGGGLFINGGTSSMSGGFINNNTASSFAGGIYVYGSSASFTMEGGKISENTVTSGSGGGVYLGSSGTFNMDGDAEISNNKSASGGGVYVTGTFTMTGGTLSNNTATSGGGVYVSSGMFTMTGGTLSNNTATSGGGVYVSSGTVTMSGGEIKSNIAPTGGVYLGSSAVFKVGGNAKVLDNKLSSDGGASKSNVVFANSTTYISLLTGDDAPVVGGMEVYVNGTSRTIVDTGARESDAQCFEADYDDFSVVYSDGKLALANRNSGEEAFWSAVASYGNATQDMVINIDEYASKGVLTLWKTGIIPDNNGQNKPTLTIKSGSGDIKIRRGIGVAGDLFTVSRGARLILNNITVDGNKDVFTASPYCGGALVYVNGELTMRNGTMLKNNKSAKNGGGVYVNGGTFNMEGGEISGNNSTINSSGNGGGGVYVSGGTFNISGSAKISENTAVRGGGVFLSGSGTSFTMSGGSINNNTSGGNGGGVMVNNSKFTMSGGMLKHNNSSGSGSGIYVYSSSALFTMTGGEISENTASDSGCGVYLQSGASIMTGGTLSSNNAASNGGGVYIGSDGTFTAAGDAEISNNKAVNGGGVYHEGQGLTLGGTSKIIDNQKTDGADDNIYLNTGKTITLGTAENAPRAGMCAGVSKSATGTFVNSGATADIRDCFFSDSGSRYVVLNGSALSLTDGRLVTLTVRKDGELWADHGKAFYLKSGSASYNGRPQSGGIYKISIPTGETTLDLYDGTTDTGIDITVSAGGVSATVNYYTVQFAVEDHPDGISENSTISAAYGNNVEFPSGTVIVAGKTVVLKATGKNASKYAYLWSGGGTNGETTKTLTISNLNAPVNATCTVTGASYDIKATAAGLDSLKVGQAVSTDAKIIFTLNESAYADTITPEDFTISGLPSGLTAGMAVCASETTVEIPITGVPTTSSDDPQTLSYSTSIPAANIMDTEIDIPVSGVLTVPAVAKGDIQGSVSISGIAEYGKVLTAETESITTPGDKNYQWKNGATEVGTNSPTYTLTAADIGKTITVAVSIEHYNPLTSTSTDTVGKATLTVEQGAYTVSKTYDGTTAAGTGGGELSVTGKVADDDVSVTATYGTYSGKDVGSNYSVLADLSLSGEDACNYQFASDTLTITDAAITPADFTVNVSGRVIRVNSDPDVLPTATVDGVNNETVSGTLEWFSDEGRTTSVGTSDLATEVSGKTFYWKFTATDPNYTDTPKTGSASFDIVDKYPAGGYITFHNGNAVYNGGELTLENATIGGKGFTEGDNPVWVYTYAVSAADGGNASLSPAGKPLTAGMYDVTASYEDADYRGGKTATFTVIPKPLTVTVAVSNKPYDGTNTAAIESAVLNGVESGDEGGVSLAEPYPAVSFADGGIGTGKAVRFAGNFTLTGTKAGNYTLAQPSGVTADIEPGFTPVKEDHYTATTLNAAGWTNGDFIIEAKPGYEVSLTNTAEGEWLEAFPAYTEETDDGSATFHVKNTATGEISSAVTERYKIDKTAPTATVSYNDNGFKSFLNKVTFGLFFKDTVDVEIRGEDALSGAAKTEYYKADAAVTDPPITDWVTGTGFSVADEKFILYARVTDAAGNASTTYSDGVVAYSDGVRDTESIRFTKTTTDPVTAAVHLNGNTVMKINDGVRDLTTPADYGVDNDTGEITFHSGYLDTLSAGSHTLTVHYHPLGVTYDGTDERSEEPDTTTITLTVSKAAQSALSITGLDSAYVYGDAAFGIGTAGGSGTGAVSYSSSNPDVATVDGESGEVTIVGAGSFTITAAKAADENYAATEATSGTITVSAKSVTVTSKDVSYAGKAYDGTTEVAGAVVSVDGILTGDTVTVSYDSAEFDDKNAGTRTVTFGGLSLNGGDAGKYELTDTTISIGAEITKASGLDAEPCEISILESDTAPHDYDLDGVVLNQSDYGTRSYALNGGLDGDTDVLGGGVALSGDGNKTLHYQGAGLDAGSATQSVTITTRNYQDVTVTITFTAIEKASTAIAVTAPVAGLTYGESPGDPSAEAEAGNVGTFTFVYSGKGNTVYAPSSEKPTEAGDYTVTATLVSDTHKGTGRADFTIRPKALAIDITIHDKPYDGTNTAAIDSASLAGVVGSDDVSLATPYPAASFADGGIGYDKAVSFAGDFTLTGTKASNYTLIQPSGVTAEIKPGFTPGKDVHYTATALNAAGWTNGDFVIAAKTGYEVSLTNTADGEWLESLPAYTEETDDGSATFYVKNTATGEIGAAVTERYKIDKSNPTATVSYSDNGFKSFLNKVTLGLFFKDEVDVEIQGEDALSGVAKTEYYKAAGAVSDSLSITDWVMGTGFSVTENEQFILYARVTDAAGNTSVIGPDGIVVYSDSIRDTESIRYTKTTTDPVTANVHLNGNTVMKINDGKKDLTTPADYSVNNDTGEITFKADYLDSLSAGSYTLTVHYNPLGTTYDGTDERSEAPDTTTISLTVGKAAQSAISLTGLDSAYVYGDAVFRVSASGGSGTGAVSYSSSNPDVATVDGESGEVTIVGSGSFTITAAKAADENYSVAEATSETVTVSAKSITVTSKDVSYNGKAYDGTTDAAGAVISADGILSGDAVTVSYGSAEFDDKNTGTRTVTFRGLSLSGEDAGKYALTATEVTKRAEITKAFGLTAEPYEISILESDTVPHDYDLDGVVLNKPDYGSRSYALNGGLDGDTDVLDGGVALRGIGNKTLHYQGAGRDAGSVTQSVTITTQNYQDATVTITFTATEKAPTAITVTAPATGLTYGELLGDPSAEAEAGNVGTFTFVYSGKGNTVYAPSSEKPSEAGDYTVTATLVSDTHKGTGRADFTVLPKALAIDITIHNKPYDGTNTATIESTSLVGVVGNDDVSLAAPYPDAFFADGGMGSGKTVSFAGNFTLTGAKAGNYMLTQPSGVMADIKPGFTPGKDVHYTATKLNAAGWTNGDFVIEAKPGYEVSLTNTADGNWLAAFPAYTEETDDGSVTFYVKNTETGEISAAVTEHYKIDKSNPTATVSYNNNGFRSFLNKITFGLFFKDTVDVQIKGEDALSGAAKTEYYKADSTVTDTLLITDWVTGTGFNVTENEKFILYARVTDAAGNTSVIGHDNIVVYSDSKQDTENIRFTKTTTDPVTASIKLNGNSVMKINDGKRDLESPDDYTVEDATGEITFNSSYLDTLSAGTYTLTVHYNPLGVTYDGTDERSEEPDTTTITLTVYKVVQSALSITGLDSAYAYGDAAFGIGTTGGSGTGAVSYSSSNPSVATVDGTTGEVTIVGPGSFTITVAKAADENYSAAEATSETVTVSVKSVTVIDSNVSYAGKAYDGTMDATGAVITADGILPGDTVTVSYGSAEFDDKNAGTRTVTFSGLSLSGEDAGKYALKATEVTKRAEITKATGLTAEPYEISILEGDTAPHDYDLDGVVLNKPDYGTRSYALNGGLDGDADVLDGGVALSGAGNRTLHYQGAGLNAGSATQTITITTDNYQDADVTITFTAKEKTPTNVTVTAPETGLTYGEGLGDPNAEAEAGNVGTYTFTYSGKGNTVYAPSTEKPTEAGDYTVTATLVSDTHVGSGCANFTISKATITITAENKSVHIGGTAPAYAYTVSGLATGETLAATPTLSCSPDLDTAGTYTITPSGAAAPAGGNYNAIAYANGTLTVTDHAWGDWNQTKAPTCTEKGFEKRICPICYTEETRDIDALGHDWAETSRTPATYLADGEIVYTCRHENSHTKTEAITMLVDDNAPEVEISTGTSNWREFLNTITFGLFFKETRTVAITAADDESGIDKIYYYKSADVLEEEAVKALSEIEWTEGGSFHTADNDKFVVYAKATDKAGNASYASSDGIVIDTAAPVISGITNGGAYYEAQTVTVTDDYLDTVKVNGTAVMLTDGTFTLSPASGTQAVVATDKAGNSTTVTVTFKTTVTITAVTDIKGVPAKGTVGTTLTLKGTVVPANATNKAITWKVKSKGATGAVLKDGKLTFTGSGKAVVTATVKNGKTAKTNYAKDFAINVSHPVEKGSTYTVSGYKYTVTSITNGKKEASFVGLTAAKKKTTTALNIKNTVTIKGTTLKVTAVGKNAIRNNAKVRAIKVGNNVQTINYGAFSQCKALKTVTIGTGLKVMDGHVFCQSTKLKTITIQSTKLKGVKNTHVFSKVKATIKVPDSKVSAYQKLFKGRKGNLKVTR